MLSQLFYHLIRVRARLAWTGMAFMMLLQRSPVQWLVAELRFSMGSRVVHLFKWVAGAGITSAFYNTVTGATGDLSRVGNTNAVEGSNVQVAVRAERAVPVTAEITGNLPPGLITNLGEGGSVPNGAIAIGGVATTAGDYPVTVTVLTWEALDEPTAQPERSIQINFEITLEPPEISKDPASIQVSLGGTAELSVEVEDPENTTFQWQKSTNLNNYDDIEGATESTFQIENVTAEDSAAYRVQVTKNDITRNSSFAFITVEAAPGYDSWKEQQFESPSSEEAQPGANPDYDVFTNAFEYLFGMDPEAANTVQAPVISREDIDGTEYVVFAFPALNDVPGLDYSFEKKIDFKNGLWFTLVHGLEGVLIETGPEGTVLKLPNEPEAYIRVKVNTD